MLTATFNRGSKFTIDGELHTIIWIMEDDRFQLEKFDKAVVIMTREDLLQYYAELRLQFVKGDAEDDQKEYTVFKRALDTFNPKISEAAIRRKKYLDFVSKYGKLISSPDTLKDYIVECARALGDEHPPSTISLYRWWKKLQRSGGDYRSLVDRFHLRGRCASRFPAAVTEIVNAAVQDIYLTGQRESGEDVYVEVVSRINKENGWLKDGDKLKVPSKASVYRYINKIDQYEVTAARYGKRVADMKYRTSKKAPGASRILERVEVDHTPLDLFVLDLVTGLPLGRPTVTLILDKYSRMVLGFHIGFQEASLEAVFHAIRHAILPKTYIKEKYPNVINTWPAFGVFEKLVCDNGMEFHAHDLERAAFEIGFQLEYCPARKPYYKGSIERYLKTLNFKFSHRLPGTSFARWFDRQDYDPAKHAVVDMESLQKLVHKWIIDVYHQSSHRTTGQTPHQRWSDSARSHPPLLLSDSARLDISLGETVSRTVTHKGIELHGGGLFYNDDYLGFLRRSKKGRVRVEVRYFKEDISYIYVIDPTTKEPIWIPAIDQDYTKGLSLQQHELIKRHLREHNKSTIDINALSEAKTEIRQIILDLSFSKSARQRRRGATVRGIGRGGKDLLADSAADGRRNERLDKTASQVRQDAPTKAPSIDPQKQKAAPHQQESKGDGAKRGFRAFQFNPLRRG